MYELRFRKSAVPGLALAIERAELPLPPPPTPLPAPATAATLGDVRRRDGLVRFLDRSGMRWW